MIHLFRRYGMVQRRAVWLLLLLVVLGAAAFWLAPWRGPGPQLRLVALTSEGAFAGSIEVAEPQPARSAGGLFSVPLVLGVANTGEQAARPDRLELLVPPSYQLIDRDVGLRGVRPAGEALVRYVIEGPFPPIEAQRVPTVLPSVDTLWLEPVLRTHYCVVGTDSIPELVAAQPADTSGTRSVSIYYSFEGGNLEQRQPGLLEVLLPGRLFAREAPAPIPSSVVEVGRPHAERPEMSSLAMEGTRTAECGGPGDPIEIFTTTWRTPEGGRFMVVQYGGVPRKQYFDMDGDSIIELELWDPDGDGLFEARRTTRIPLPEFLLPMPEPVPDSLLPDSLRRDTLRRDSLGRPVRPPAGQDTAGTWPFLPRQPGQQPVQPGQQPAQQPDPAEDGATPPPQEQEPAVEPDPEPEPTPQPRPPRRNVPLGDPVGR